MLQQLLKQIWIQRKVNGWILLELIIVSVVMWYIIMPVFVICYNRGIPSGFNYKNVYQIELGELPSESFRYDEKEAEPENNLANFYRIVERIKQLPEVELVAFSGNNSHPYGQSFSAAGYTRDTVSIQLRILFFVPGDYFKVFGFHSFYGDGNIDPDDTEINENSLFITRDAEKQLFGEESAIGKTITSSGERTIVGVVDYVKMAKSGQPTALCFQPIMKIDNNKLLGEIQVFIKAKEGTSGKKLVNYFREELIGKLRIGNLYVKDIISGAEMEKEAEYTNDVTNELRIRIAIALFFLFNIILGMIGTFWIRSESRRAEVGLRMAMGSTRLQIRKQFLLEGFLLTTLAIVVSCFILINSIRINGVEIDQATEFADWYLVNNTPLLFITVMALIYSIILIAMTIGVWFPATAASKVSPIEALREE